MKGQNLIIVIILLYNTLQTAVLPPSSPPLKETWKGSKVVVVPFQPSGEGIEVRLRHAAKYKRLRVTEYFKDFDPLRSGFISSK